MMRKSVAVDMEQSENFLDMNDGESVRYFYTSKYRGFQLCCTLIITHLITTGLGVYGGILMCEFGEIECSCDGSN